MRDTDGNSWEGCDPRYDKMFRQIMDAPSRPLDQQDAASEIGRLNANGRGNSGFIAIDESEQFAVRVTQRF